MEPKVNWQNVSRYKWQKTVVLTREEGTEFDALIRQFDCANASQLCKKIAKGELKLVPRKKSE